jgi:UDP-glucose 4-epimerase
LSTNQVLITGGAGFIGANLCVRLIRDGIQVRVLDDLSTGDRQNLDGLPVEFVHGSILDGDLLLEAVRGCSNVVHLAAVPSVPRSIADPLRSHEANATGTLRVLDAARRHGGVHVTLASSSSVYGSNPALPKSEALQCRPVSPYAVSKLAAEQYAMAYSRCYGLEVLPFRFFNVFGPLQSSGHDYAAVIPAFLEAALRDRPLPLYGDGLQSRDFTFVGTVVEIIARAVAQRIASSPVNLAFGTRTTLTELVRLIQDVLGRDVMTEELPARSGDVRHSQAETTRLRVLFPDIVPTPLREGVALTAAWLAEELAAR